MLWEPAQKVNVTFTLEIRERLPFDHMLYYPHN